MGAIKISSNGGAFNTTNMLLRNRVTKESKLLQINTQIGINITGQEFGKKHATSGIGRFPRLTRFRKTFADVRNFTMECNKGGECVEDSCDKVAKVALGLRAA